MTVPAKSPEQGGQRKLSILDLWVTLVDDIRKNHRHTMDTVGHYIHNPARALLQGPVLLESLFDPEYGLCWIRRETACIYSWNLHCPASPMRNSKDVLGMASCYLCLSERYSHTNLPCLQFHVLPRKLTSIAVASVLSAFIFVSRHLLCTAVLYFEEQSSCSSQKIMLSQPLQ